MTTTPTMLHHPTTSQWASAAMHLELRHDPLCGWRTIRIDGVRYVALTSGTSGHVYLVRADADGCGCTWYERTGRQCSHMLALEAAAMEDELRESAPAPAAPIVPLTTWLDEVSASSSALAARSAYERLFPPCRYPGCTEPPEAGGQDCSRHMLCDAF